MAEQREAWMAQQREAWMAEQRRRLGQQMDRAIDRMPEPPMFGTEEPVLPPSASRGGPPAGTPGWGDPRMEPSTGYPGYGRGSGYGPAPYRGEVRDSHDRSYGWGPDYGPGPYPGYGAPTYGR